ncbi:MAG TPA: choice-of-anchor D domain-containing protein [Candidatus Kapabacteria bacterium]|nr:choice-of-anchor D domain-containing protein [Candidatus Kapabacteria bacterium]
MKLLGTKPLGLALVMAALFLGVSQRAYGYVISVWPDTVTMTTAVGTSTDAYIYLSDGRDTSQNLPLGTVSVSLSGSSQFTMLTDSVLQFAGYTVIQVRYSPTSDYAATARLRIQGDSNIAYVYLTGNPITHVQPQVTVVNYDTLREGHQRCDNFSIYNPNADSIWITQVTLTNNSQNGYSLENIVTLPAGIASHQTLTMGELCALATTDSELYGNLQITYNYGSGTDQANVTLYSGVQLPQTECVSGSDGDFGPTLEGTSVTKSITFTNTSNSAVSLDSAEIVSGDYGQFAINSSFPISIAAGSSADVSITFSAPNSSTKNYYSAIFDAAVHGTSIDSLPCSSVSVPLSASVYLPVVDSITLDAPPGSSTISITARAQRSLHAIFIHNAGMSVLSFQYLTIGDSSLAYFGSEGYEIAELYYDTVSPGETVGPVLLTLDAADTGTYNLDLTLTYVVNQAHKNGNVPLSSSYNYTVVAHRLPPLNASVSEPNAPAAANFTLSPNPARDAVTIGLPDGTSNVEIYDVLGNLIFQGTEHGSFVWDGARSGSPVANGSYIVRVSQGNQVSSQRLIFVR